MNVRREGRLPDVRPPDIACVQQTSARILQMDWREA
jgi:hypothetical protein